MSASHRFQSAVSQTLTPPWVEQYMYHLSKSCRNAEMGQYSPPTREWGKGYKVEDANKRVTRNRRLILLRWEQHKAMKEALYQVGHPLWERVK